MRNPAVPASQSELDVPALRRWLLVGALLLAAGLGLLAMIPPVQALVVEGRLLAEHRDEQVLADALIQWARAETGREIELEAGEHGWHRSLGDLGLTISESDLAAALKDALAQTPWWKRGPFSRTTVVVEPVRLWDDGRLERTLLPMAAAVRQESISAELLIREHQPVITPDREAISLETPVVMQALKELGEGDRLELPLTRHLAPVTAAELERLSIRRLIAEWTTHYDPSIPRADNVAKAAAAFNGVRVAPGQILSYNATVGPISTATGWKQAYVIVNGELVPGVGGGVCQVATTMYGALLRANLEIVERHPHQLVVGYVTPSQDAAIAQGWEDLKFRNTSPGHLLIETESGGGTVTFRIYGDMPVGQEVRIESRVLGARPFPTRMIDDPTLLPGQQAVKISGAPGLDSEAYRLLFQDGRLLKRELLSRDSYLPTAQVVLRGPVPAPPPPGP